MARKKNAESTNVATTATKPAKAKKPSAPRKKPTKKTATTETAPVAEVQPEPTAPVEPAPVVNLDPPPAIVFNVEDGQVINRIINDFVNQVHASGEPVPLPAAIDELDDQAHSEIKAWAKRRADYRYTEKDGVGYVQSLLSSHRKLKAA